MKLQQVNLYLPELRVKREWLTAASLLASSVGVVVVYVIIYAVSNHNLQKLKQQVVTLESQRTIAEAQIEKIKTRAKPFLGNEVEAQLQYLYAALRSRKQVGAIIEGQNLGNINGFASAFEALARQSMNSIALEKISLSRGGQYLQLRGQTTRPEDVATYIQKLQSEVTFKRASFGLLSVAAGNNLSTTHVFSLGFESVYDLAVETRE